MTNIVHRLDIKSSTLDFNRYKRHYKTENNENLSI